MWCGGGLSGPDPSVASPPAIGRPRARTAGRVWLGIALVGCAGEPVATVTTTDSAGVRVTVNRDLEATFAFVEAEPTISIGGPDATGPEQFSQIQGVLLDARGRLWVADGRSGELRIFASDGSHWKTRGGTGEGPGEFQRIRLLGTFGGDSVALGDRASDRMTVYDAAGELARTVRFASELERVPLAHRVFEDGSILGQVPRLFAAGSIEPGQIIGDTARLVRVRAGGSMSDMAEAEGPLWLWTGRSQVPIPFTANPGLVVVDSTLHLVAGPDFRVRVFDSGRLVESYGVDRPPRPVAEEDLLGYRAMTEQYVGEQQRPDFLAALDHEARPGVLPAYRRVLTDVEGNVWAQWYSPDTTWDVYAPSRRLLGQVEVPDGFWPEDIRDGALAGVWRDELTVEHVRVYPYRIADPSRDP